MSDIHPCCADTADIFNWIVMLDLTWDKLVRWPLLALKGGVFTPAWPVPHHG